MRKIISLVLTFSLIASLAVVMAPVSSVSAAVEKKFVIDGYLDPYYITSENEYSWEYIDAWQGDSGHDPYFPSTPTDQASVWTAYDNNFIYVYVKVMNDRYPYMQWDDAYAEIGLNSSMVDSIAIWMDQDPYTQVSDWFFENTKDPGQTDTQFRFLTYDQRWHDYQDTLSKRAFPVGKTFGEWLRDPQNTCFLYNDNDGDGNIDGYSLEVRYPRVPANQRDPKVELEDCYHFNVVSNFSSNDYDDNYCMALAPDWWISYDGTPKIFFNDAQNPFFDDSRTDIDLSGVESVNAKISALPAPASTTSAHKAQVMAAYDEYQALEPQYQALVSNVSKLMECYEKVKEDPKPTIVYGDIDGKGGVTSTDALLALQKSIKKIELTDDQFLAADVDGNKQITSTDSLLILQYSIKKIDKFPVEE